MQRYKSVHTGPQIDSGVARALPGGIIDQMRPTRNLLDNWDFRNPVNQRGQTNYTIGYTVDRWFIPADSTVSVGNGYITVNRNANNYVLFQRIEKSRITFGKTYTLSLMKADGTIISATGVIPNTENQTVLGTGSTTGVAISIWTCATTDNFVQVQIVLLTQDSTDIKAVKLELGTVSTLANDPPADYGAELAKCKRYFNLWASDAARTAALQEVGAMRTTPVLSTLTISGTTYYTASADL